MKMAENEDLSFIEKISLELKAKIRDIPDFPIKGILFRDITTLLQDTKAFRLAIDTMSAHYKGTGIQTVAAVEARGYILGSPLAYQIGAGFVPVRKPGKLPADKVSESYSLEYGNNILEIHRDAVKPGDKVLIVDDLIATGGSALATKNLIEKVGGKVVGFCFLIELTDLNGRKLLKDTDVFSLIKY